MTARHQQSPVHVGIGHVGDDFGGAGAQCGETTPRFASQPTLDIRHERHALLMAGQDEATGRGEQDVDQILVFLVGSCCFYHSGIKRYVRKRTCCPEARATRLNDPPSR